MTFDYSPLKLVKGSANVNPIEDPVLGANGTANVIRINKFIDQVELDMRRLVPQGKGNIIIGGSTEPMELQAGPNNYCLTVDPTTPTGLVWEERVDTTTNQTVGGKKTFTSDMEVMQDLQVGLDLGVGGNTTVVGSISAHNGHLTGTLEVGSSTLLHSTLTVANNTTLHTNFSVGGASALHTAVVSSTLNVGGNVQLDSGLKVVGPTTMQSNLSLDGNANVSGSVVVGNDVLITDSLSVSGAANLASLSVTGPTALITTTTNSLTVTGEANLHSLSLAGGLVVGTTLSTGGSITSGGDITTTKALTVGGTSNLSGVTATTITTSGTTTTGRLVALQPTTLNDTLWVGGSTELRSSLLVVGNSSLRGDLTVAGTTKLDRTTTADISVNGAALIRESLTVDGPTAISDDLTVDGSTFVEGSSTVELDLTVGGRTVLAGPLQAPSAVIANLTTTTGKVGTLTADTLNAVGITYTGAMTGNTATLNTLSTQGIDTTTMKAITLTITGSAEIPGLSGINTGDEVAATRTISGTVRITSDIPDPIVYTVSDAQAAFIGKSEVGTTLATLVGGKVPITQLPATAITDTHVVTTIEAMNALTAQVGDVAILTNPASTYILQTEPNGWVMLNTPTDAVPSVFNRVGPIQAQAGDYTATMIPITAIPTINANHVQAALERLALALTTHTTYTNNPHRVTVEQVGAIAMYEKGSGMGVATLDEDAKVPLSQLPGDLLLASTSRMVREFTTTDLLSGVLTVQHALGQKYPSSVTVYSNLDRVVVPDDIEVVDSSTLKVYLNSFTTMQGTWKVVVAV